MTKQIPASDECPCIGPSCGRAHRDDDPCHCPELVDRATWHEVIVPAAVEGEVCANGWSPRGHHSIDGTGVYLLDPEDLRDHGRLHFCTEACRGEWSFHVRGDA